MKVYRIKHIPTGMFFVPSRHITSTWKKYCKGGSFCRVKSNLSKPGKLYTRRPTIKHLPEHIATHMHEGYDCFGLRPMDWIVEEAV